jgi:hypothetical protein
VSPFPLNDIGEIEGVLQKLGKVDFSKLSVREDYHAGIVNAGFSPQMFAEMTKRELLMKYTSTDRGVIICFVEHVEKIFGYDMCIDNSTGGGKYTYLRCWPEGFLTFFYVNFLSFLAFFFGRVCTHRVNLKESKSGWIVGKVHDSHDHDPVFAEVAGRRSIYVFNERKDKLTASEDPVNMQDARDTLNANSTPAAFLLTDTQLRSVVQV